MTKTTVALFLALTACADNLTDPQPEPQPQAEDAPGRLGPVPNTDHLDKKVCLPSALRLDLPWYGDNRTTLTSWMDSLGCASPGYKHNKPPVALFDWDNTIIKNDVGDAITFHLISHDKVLQPPDQDWTRTNRFMTADGAAALTAACGTVVPAGQPLPTSTDDVCALEILSMYIDNKTTGNLTAFSGHDFRRMEPTYAWTAQLLAGYTTAEVQDMTLAAVTPMLAAPLGTTQTIAGRALNGWLRLYDQSIDLVRGFQSRGYDVWIITASPNPVVAAMAPMVGIAGDHVVGIRQLRDGAGRLTYDFEGCGPVADGDNTMISYIEGKRCWVNKVIYGDHTANAIARRPVDQRQVFGAGDSDTDIEFLRDATYKLMLNRQKKEVMCFAYHNENDSWRVNPMFIEPKGKLAAGYPCSTTACKDSAGVGRPCLDETGAVIPDQLDTVFAP